MASAETLAAKIRVKYPGAYDDLSDTELEAKIDAKFPGAYDDLPRSTAASPADSYRPSFQGGGPSAPVIPGESKFPVGEYAKAGLSGLGAAASVLPFMAPAAVARTIALAGAAGEGVSAVKKAADGDVQGALGDAALALLMGRAGMRSGAAKAVEAVAPKVAQAEATATKLPAAAQKVFAGPNVPGEKKVVDGLEYVWGKSGGWRKTGATSAPMGPEIHKALPEAARKAMRPVAKAAESSATTGAAKVAAEKAQLGFAREAAKQNPKWGEKIWMVLDASGAPLRAAGSTTRLTAAEKAQGYTTTWIRNVWN